MPQAAPATQDFPARLRSRQNQPERLRRRPVQRSKSHTPDVHVAERYRACDVSCSRCVKHMRYQPANFSSFIESGHVPFYEFQKLDGVSIKQIPLAEPCKSCRGYLSRQRLFFKKHVCGTDNNSSVLRAGTSIRLCDFRRRCRSNGKDLTEQYTDEKRDRIGQAETMKNLYR